MDEINADFFTGNRRRLRELFTGTAPILLSANGLLQRIADTNFPFNQDPNFWYLTGVDVPDALLFMYKDKECLIMPDTTDYGDIFNGEVKAESLMAISGIESVMENKEGWKLIEGTLKRIRHLATLAPPASYIPTYNMYANPARASLIRKLRDKSPDLDILDLSEHFKTMRFVKQPSEIAAIKKSVDITCRAINSARRHHYEYEYEAEADISRSFRRDGAAGHAYDPIVASGINACVLHYQENSSKIEEGALILADVGASYNHYGADITRTWSQNKATPRQQAVISAVNDAVEFSLEPLKPGVIYADVISDLRSFVGEKLRELGLIKTISEEEVFRYYPHSPHFLGLATHDVGDYHAPLVPGVVLTVEPGIYIKEEGIGVRIEEDVLITDNGYELLSAKLPRIF